MDDKISIILPIFNVGLHLRGGIDSLINQTIGNDNLEIMMVDDCSTDESGKIIDEYDEKYECCKAIHLGKNSGSPGKPRNIGIEKCTGDYIMFLDPDDRYVPNACEVLYNAVTKYNADMAFGRFRRIFNYGEKVQKSYSPYLDNLKSAYPDETFEVANPLNVSDYVWDHVLEHVLYGKRIQGKYERNNPIDVIHVKSIKEEPDLLKMAPSVWTKIFKRELIIDNNIHFQPFICAEDLIFTLETLLKAKGIVYLNNFMSCDYYVRDSPDDKSITNNVDVRFLSESMDSYIYARQCTERFSKEIQNISVNPHLIYWMYTWKKSKFTKNENKLLLNKVETLKKIHKTDLKTRILLSSMTTAIESVIKRNKE